MMDFEENKGVFGPSQVQQPGGTQGQDSRAMRYPDTGQVQTRTGGKGTGWRIFWGIVLAFSVLANVGLFFIVVGLVALFSVGQSRAYNEAVIEEGPRLSKIVVLSIAGEINSEQSENVHRQLREAREDRSIKGLIIRVNSPGGTISDSDGIYREIQKYRQETGKPVVAFMQGVAASGAYYASVACDKIVAEPTVITGSIGVLMRHFVFQELLEHKLGILPVILTEGKKKDWPSSFKSPSEEELQYLREKVLLPAHERFMEVVAEGRQGSLTLREVKDMADGGVLGAKEAVEKKLIDEVGYLDDAIKVSKTLAGIGKARVVEYRRVFSLSSLLSSRNNSVLKFDLNTLQELCTPQVLYLWSAY